MTQEPTSRDKESPVPGSSHEAQALDSLGIVVGEIAHDFNNILSLIFGYVEMALSEIPEGQRARSDLEHVLAAGDRGPRLLLRRGRPRERRLEPLAHTGTEGGERHVTKGTVD